MRDILSLDASKRHLLTAFQFLVTGVRILIGWHFLYEGISKLFAPNWTSTGYLLESHWLFSSLFHWMAENPVVLNIVDQINIWGLILIGIFLFFGLFTRIASATGAFFLLLYYIAQPPLVGFLGEATGEGHYLIVNKNLIEFFILVVFLFIPRDIFYGFDRWYARNFKTPIDEGKTVAIVPPSGRREFLKDLVTLPLFGGFIYSLFKKRQWESFEELNLVSGPSRVDATTGASPVGVSYKTLSDLKAPVPCGKMGDFEISRLICGGNLISGYAHSRDLIYVSSLVQSYFTDEKVLETMRLCEACGINTIILRVDNNTLRIMKKYRQRGGKMHWIAQIKVRDQDIKSDIDAAIDNSAMSAYIQGNVADNCVAQGKVDLLLKALEYIKKRAVLAGIAGHDLNVIITCEAEGLQPDFYMKTLNSGNYWTAGPRLINDVNWKPDPHRKVDLEYNQVVKDNIWAVSPMQTVEFMKSVHKPWIAYKVLGAGAIHPKEGFKYAFESGADFACVGMFDFQIVENANIINDVLNANHTRTRPWFA